MIGTTLGDFEVVDEIGRGGMATVYRARQPSLDRFVALKVLSRVLTEDPDFVARFKREAQTAAALEHPNVVAIYEVGEAAGSAFIAMRLVSGASLARLIAREGPFELGRALHLLEQVASALDFAHARGFIHRDVKPSNVMVESGDRVVLVDFGIAHASAGHRHGGSRLFAGTVEYMAPEQIQNRPAGPGIDLYALGVVAFEMLTGRVPFRAVTDLDPAVLHSHVYETPPRLRTFRPDMPARAEAAVARALAKRAEDRFRNASEFVDALAGRGARRPSTPKLTTRIVARAAGLPLVAAGVTIAALTLVLALDRSEGSGASPTRVVAAATTLPTPAIAPSPQPISSVAGVAAAPTTSPTVVPTPLLTATGLREPTSSTVPTLTTTRTVDQEWTALQPELDVRWGRDWPVAADLLQQFLVRFPDHAAAKDKLYAALVSYAGALVAAGQRAEAAAQLQRASAVLPSRPEARAVLVALTPTAIVSPEPRVAAAASTRTSTAVPQPATAPAVDVVTPPPLTPTPPAPPATPTVETIPPTATPAPPPPSPTRRVVAAPVVTGAEIRAPSTVELLWSFNGQLNTNEFFDIRIWRPGEREGGGIANIKGTSYLFSTTVCSTYSWTVAIVARDSGRVEQIAHAATAGTFNISEGGNFHCS